MNSEVDNKELVIKACRYILKHESIAKEARDYIDKRVSNTYQAKFDIGYFPSNSDMHILEGMVGRDVLEEHFLAYPIWESGALRLQSYFRHHNIVMPFRNAHGDIISILGRSILEKEQLVELKIDKYKYSLNSNKDLYVFGLDLAKKTILEKGYLIGVEGQFDCIKCHENGLTNVVAFGWANITKYQFYQIRKYTSNIFIMMDNDSAGSKAKDKIKRIYNKYGNIKTINIPDPNSKDIDECLRSSSFSKRNKIIKWLNNL